MSVVLGFSHPSEMPFSSRYRSPFLPPCAHQGRFSLPVRTDSFLSPLLTCSSSSIWTVFPHLQVLGSVSLLGSRSHSPCAAPLPTCFLLDEDVLLLSQTLRRSVQISQRQPYQTLLPSGHFWPWFPLCSSIPSFSLYLCGHNFPAFLFLTSLSSPDLPGCSQPPQTGLALFHQCSCPLPQANPAASLHWLPYPSGLKERKGSSSVLIPMGWTCCGSALERSGVSISSICWVSSC